MDFYRDNEESGSKMSALTRLQLVQYGSQCGAYCSFVEIETEILCATWTEFAWLEARRLLAKSGHRNVDRLENWDVMELLLLEIAKAHTMMEKKREGRHLGRAELNRLCRAIWRKRRALKRETHLTQMKESAEKGNAP